MSLKSKMPLQVWILTLSAFAIGTAEFVIAGVLPQVAATLGVTEGIHRNHREPRLHPPPLLVLFSAPSGIAPADQPAEIHPMKPHPANLLREPGQRIAGVPDTISITLPTVPCADATVGMAHSDALPKPKWATVKPSETRPWISLSRGNAVELINNLRSHRVCVPEQHSGITVATDQRDLWRGQTAFKETADGLMSQIMETEILDLCPSSHSLPRQSQSISRDWE